MQALCSRRPPRISAFPVHGLLFLSAWFIIIATTLAFEGLTPDGLAHYRTEPDLLSPKVTVEVRGSEKLIAPGYIIVEPLFEKDGEDGRGLGPQLFDTYGNLVWCGNGVREDDTLRTQAAEICSWEGSSGTHICFNEVHELDDDEDPGNDHVDGHVGCSNQILDNTYTPVASGGYGQVGEDYKPPNPHEFTTAEYGYSLLRLAYLPRAVDLTHLNGSTDAHVDDGCFQEIDTSGKELFRWCTLDHVDISETYEFEGIVAQQSNNDPVNNNPIGSKKHPFSAVHINAVDKTPDGHYLVSNRRFGSIIKVAGSSHPVLAAGEIIWRAGGKLSNFTFDDPDAQFNGQHHIRLVSSNSSGDVFSLYDNTVGGGEKAARKVSSGKLFYADNTTWTLTLLGDWPHPQGLVSKSQGSMNLLPNSRNAFVGWGAFPQFTEFAPNGDVLLHGIIGGRNTSEEGLFNYRVHKTESWVAHPPWDPKLLVYSQSCDGQLVAYVSWNGATEVKRWQFFFQTTHSKSRSASWVPVGTWDKDGFETRVALPTRLFGGVPSTVSVAALDSRGNPIAKTKSRTFVPRPKLNNNGTCDAHGCELGFDYNKHDNRVGKCTISLVPSLIAFALAMMVLEFGVYIFTIFLEMVEPITPTEY